MSATLERRAGTDRRKGGMNLELQLLAGVIAAQAQLAHALARPDVAAPMIRAAHDELVATMRRVAPGIKVAEVVA